MSAPPITVTIPADWTLPEPCDDRGGMAAVVGAVGVIASLALFGLAYLLADALAPLFSGG